MCRNRNHREKDNPMSMKSTSRAYDEEEFQTFIFNKTQQFKNDVRNHLSKNLTVSKITGLAFVSIPVSEPTQIIDLGGGAGLDFYISRELFNSPQKWICLETEAMCEVLNKKRFKEKNLSFETPSKFLNSVQIGLDFCLYSNSALQYMRDPIGTLDSFLIKRPRRVAIIRTPLVISGVDVRLLQKSNLEKNGPQVGEFYGEQKEIVISVRIERLESIKKLFNRHGYQIVCENIQEGSFTHKSKFPRFRENAIKTVDLLAWRID